MKHILKTLTSVVLASALLSACHSRQGWELNGVISSTDGDTLVIEHFMGGKWLPLDTVVSSPGGAFEYRADAPAEYPEIFRITNNNRSVYFPIDSMDVVTLESDINTFGSVHKLSGTRDAAAFSTVDSLLYGAVSEAGEQAALNDPQLKRTLSELLLANDGLLMPYYVVTKTLCGQPVYNPTQSRDLAVIGAVAQKFTEALPDDPRTAYLVKLFTTHKFAGRTGEGNVVEVEATGLPEDITRYDRTGNPHTLSEVATNAPATVLSFTVYGSVPPAYNVELNKAYEKYSPSGLQIYQMSFDNEDTFNRVSANLPWIAVWSGLTDKENSIPKSYNLTKFPVTYILNSDGEVVERVDDPAKISAALGKYF